MSTPEANRLTVALNEWRDAGAPTEDVVAAVVALIRGDDVPFLGPTCDDCGGPHELNYWVPDEVWARIRPDQSAPEGGGGVLCPHCIDRRCDAAGLENVPLHIHFVGHAATTGDRP